MFTSKRKNTLVFSFEKHTRRVSPTALEIMDWLTEVIAINSDAVHATQLDTDEYCVYGKFLEPVTVDRICSRIGKKVEFLHRDGTKSTVTVRRADANYLTVRVLNVPIETDNKKLKEALSNFGEVKEITNERWGPQYNLQCFNGVRSVEMEVKNNIPSHITVDGCKAHVIYTGQTPTCYICNESGHFRQQFPRCGAVVLKSNLTQRRKLTLDELLPSDNTLASEVVDTNKNRPENSSTDKTELPPMTDRSGTEFLLSDSGLQNKKRPLEHNDDLSDEESLVRKLRPSSGELVEEGSMQVDSENQADKEAPMEAGNIAEEQERTVARSAAVPIKEAHIPPQHEQHGAAADEHQPASASKVPQHAGTEDGV